MVTLVTFAIVLLALLFLFRLLSQVFRRTPPDDREPPEDALVGASTDGRPKPPPSSIKLDLPKDPD